MPASKPAMSDSTQDTHAHGHAHSHGHGHQHGGGHMHVHGSTNETRLAWALVVIALFMIVEIVGGVISGSLAVIADAVHMASDVVALGMSWAALRIGRRPANAQLSYGYRRLEVLVAFVNGLTLLVISAGVMIEAVRRFAEPQPVLGPMMMAVAVAGLASNLIAFAILNGGSRENLNMRSAWLHVLGDMVSSLAAIVAAGIIMLTGFSKIDPILSLLVSLMILRGAWQIVRSSARILLEATPSDLDLETVRADLLAEVPGVADVHHMHAWSLTAEHTVVTLHIRAAHGVDPLALPAAISSRLNTRFSIEHATVQVESDTCADHPTPTRADDEHEHGHDHPPPQDEHDHDHSHAAHDHAHASDDHGRSHATEGHSHRHDPADEHADHAHVPGDRRTPNAAHVDVTDAARHAPRVQPAGAHAHSNDIPAAMNRAADADHGDHADHADHDPADNKPAPRWNCYQK